MSETRRSIFQILGLPDGFQAALLVAALGLALSPYLGGADFGPLKIPAFGSASAHKLRILGPVILVIVGGLSLPLWRPRKKPELQTKPPLVGGNAVSTARLCASATLPAGKEPRASGADPPFVASADLVPIAAAAGQLARDLSARARTSIQKGPAGIVTAADVEIEELICDLLKKRYPSCTIISEESHPDAPPGALTFYLDPIDGTVNYAHGIPYSGISIAAYRAGRTVAAVVHDIFQQITYAADLGKGATAQHHSSQLPPQQAHSLHVSSTEQLSDALLITGFSSEEHGEARRSLQHLWRLLTMTHGIRRFGAASLDLASTAAGRADGYWETGITGLWDVLAGALLVAEAGGVADVFYDASTGRTACLASNGRLYQQLHRVTAPQFRDYQLFEQMGRAHAA